MAISGCHINAWADEDIQFDSRFLELKGDTKIDLKRFSSQGYVEPGKYSLQVEVNKQPLPGEYDIYWYATENDANKTYACLSPDLAAQLGFKEDIANNLQWVLDGKCLKPGQLDGLEMRADLSQSALLITLPQAYLEYSDVDWDPPSRWDDGISGLIADYSINAQTDMKKIAVMTATISAATVRLALTSGRGACEPTGRTIISIPAVMIKRRKTAPKETGTGAVTMPGARYQA